MAAVTVGLSVPLLPTKRSRHEVVADDPLESLETGDDMESRDARPPEMATSVDSHSVTAASHSSEPRRIPSPHQPQRCLLEPSDTAEDSSAYAESLEGGSGNKYGVPFYPGMHVHHPPHPTPPAQTHQVHSR
jgi:hypothetical protein